MLGNIEDDAVWIFELTLEIAMTFVTKVEEEFATIFFDASLGFGEIVHLDAEMVRPDESDRIFEVRGFAAGAGRKIQQMQGL